MRLWWETLPGLRQAEMDAFEARGWRVRVDPAAEAQGFLVVHVEFPLDGEALPLRVAYPAQFPYFRPAVYAPPGRFPEHQNPIDGVLCLLGPRTQEWHPETTVAGFLEERIPALLDAIDGGRPLVEQQAEIRAGYLPYDDPSYVLFDSAWAPPAGARSGSLVAKGALLASGERLLLRMAITKAKTGGREIPVEVVPFQSAPGSFTIEFPFAVVDGLDMEEKPDAHWAKVAHLFPGLDRRLKESTVGGKKWQFAVAALLAAEEIQKGIRGFSFVTFLIHRPKGTRDFRVARIRGLRAGRQDMGARVPATQILRDRHVLLVGCGAIGGQIAVELSKAGLGRLTLFDYDHVEPGPTVRWPLGQSFFGESKSAALAAHIKQHWPQAKVTAYTGVVGGAAVPEGPVEGVTLDEVMEGVHLVIDATAEVGVQHYMSDRCREVGIPYIYASATPGAKGGIVARFMPRDGQGCWFCLQHAMYQDGAIQEPGHDDAAEVLPAGCNHPTFAGAGYDLLEVSLQGVRMAVQALDPRRTAETFAAVLDFKEELGLPAWRAHGVPRFGGCECQG
ncbi:ThiF family adenylyltransferase [Indioceanicola profundi]|uniref:ThiF family adenylyltransferase n=1 Tax=Indioceanicola profundi TaxID=2220096 RepID=UPI000E6ACCE8|nr:ThiF family adenylyltransferase [Indioceanicola profundi]